MLMNEGNIEPRRPVQGRAKLLPGSLKRYARGKRFPSHRRISEALRRGLTR